MKYSKKDYLQVSGKLFREVQEKRVFPDSKTFVDSVPKNNPEEIYQLYSNRKENFDIKNFTETYFKLPTENLVQPNLPEGRSMEEHIILLWKYLKRDNLEPKNFSSLINLPKPYIIPGGRFREIYYWDSFFTMQGLVISNELETAENMLDNFAYLIDTVGHVPNGNRVYYISRSQPPFFAAMIDLISKYKTKEWQLKYLTTLQKEYDYWMNDETRLVNLGDAKYLNRYYDSDEIPREESYFEDFSEAKKLPDENQKKFYKNIRAACESGWDFSSRWFEDETNLSSCVTTEIIPVDLNSLLYFTEQKLAELYLLERDEKRNEEFLNKALRRKETLNKFCWKNNFYFDYNFKKKQTTETISLAAVYPLFFKIVSDDQAIKVAEKIESEFLKPGGLISTTNYTGQQWDAPNGWPPLQWLTIIGLRNYGFSKLADEIKSRWLKLNRDVFKRTGKMFEKYNVEDISLFAGGGEYDLQDGFGWTNGVAIALSNDLDINS